MLLFVFIFYTIPCFAYVYNPGNNPGNYIFRGSSESDNSDPYAWMNEEEDKKNLHDKNIYAIKWAFVICALMILLGIKMIHFQKCEFNQFDKIVFIPVIGILFIVSMITVSLYK